MLYSKGCANSAELYFNMIIFIIAVKNLKNIKTGPLHLGNVTFVNP